MNNTAKIVNDYCKKFESEGVTNDAKIEGGVGSVNKTAENSCNDFSAQDFVGAQENSGRGKASAEAAFNLKDCKVEAKVEGDAEAIVKILDKIKEIGKEVLLPIVVVCVLGKCICDRDNRNDPPKAA